MSCKNTPGPLAAHHAEAPHCHRPAIQLAETPGEETRKVLEKSKGGGPPPAPHAAPLPPLASGRHRAPHLNLRRSDLGEQPRRRPHRITRRPDHLPAIPAAPGERPTPAPHRHPAGQRQHRHLRMHRPVHPDQPATPQLREQRLRRPHRIGRPSHLPPKGRRRPPRRSRPPPSHRVGGTALRRNGRHNRPRTPATSPAGAVGTRRPANAPRPRRPRLCHPHDVPRPAQRRRTQRDQNHQPAGQREPSTPRSKNLRSLWPPNLRQRRPGRSAATCIIIGPFPVWPLDRPVGLADR